MRIALAVVPAWSIKTAPLGVACVAGALKSDGHDGRIFDLNVRLWRMYQHVNGDPWEFGNVPKWIYGHEAYRTEIYPLLRADFKKMVEDIADWQPDVFGVSTYETSYFFGRKAAEIMKFMRPQTKVVLGGPGVCRERLKYEQLLRPRRDGSRVVDVAVVGEGEATIVDLFRRLERGLPLRGCHGIAYSDEHDNLVLEPDRPNVQLTELPNPWFGDLDFSMYDDTQIPVMMSRGCVAKCTFCSETRYWNKFRYREAPHIFNEFVAHARDYGIRTFAMADSLINGNFRVLEQLADLIIASGEKITWHGYARLDARMTPELLAKLKRAGVDFMTFGLETGSQKVMNLMDKRTTVDVCSRVIRDTHAAGIAVHVNIVVGFPNETEEDFQMTIDFLRDHIDCITTVNTGETLGVPPDTPLFSDPARFGIKTKPDGRIYFDEEHRSWVSADGTNTFPIRQKRLQRLRDFVDSYPNVYRGPAPGLPMTPKPKAKPPRDAGARSP